MPWFSVRCIVRHTGCYEERVTIWDTDSFDGAVVLAEAEVREYCDGLDAEYVGLAQAYRLDEDTELGSGAEVFSLIRESDLPPDEYVTTFFDTGTERQERS